MGKRKVLNESALKEIRLPEEGELLGRVMKLLGTCEITEGIKDTFISTTWCTYCVSIHRPKLTISTPV